MVNDCSKSRRKGGQVGVEKMSESKPSDDASKGLAAVKTAGAVFLREESEAEALGKTSPTPLERMSPVPRRMM